MPPEVAEAVIERADYACELMKPGVCTGRGEQIHHRKLRKHGGEHSLANCVLLCRACHHEWVHAHPAWSYEAGWLVKSNDVPVWPPRYYRGVWSRKEEDNGDDQARSSA
jgi:hypothetical protein